MTQQLVRSKLKNIPGMRPGKEPYLFINIIFAGIIIVVMAYSGIFSPVKNDYPVACIHEKVTGEPCASCGLSHSFSLILRGQIDEALTWNSYGLRVFIFFAAQLLMRIVFSFYYIMYPGNRDNLILSDSAGSGIMFILTFWPFMRWIVVTLLN